MILLAKDWVNWSKILFIIFYPIWHPLVYIPHVMHCIWWCCFYSRTLATLFPISACLAGVAGDVLLSMVPTISHWIQLFLIYTPPQLCFILCGFKMDPLPCCIRLEMVVIWVSNCAVSHIWELPVIHYHKVMVIYPYPFLVAITHF